MVSLVFALSRRDELTPSSNLYRESRCAFTPSSTLKLPTSHSNLSSTASRVCSTPFSTPTHLSKWPVTVPLADSHSYHSRVTHRLFVTAVRGTAVGCASTLGRLVSIVAPLIAANLYAGSGSNGVLYLGAGGAFVAGIASVFLPETRGKLLY